MANFKEAIRGIDLMKFLMAIVIVSIHVEFSKVIGPSYIPFQDCAVPVFFVFSSYFFFKKMRFVRGREIWRSLFRYEKRVNKLYLFWIVVLSPSILYVWHREYLELPVWQAIGSFVKNYFFAYEFGASWFLGALIVGMPIVLLLTKMLSDKLVWVIPFAIYIYISTCPDDYLFQLYESNLRTPLLSFPHSLWWLSLGHLLSNALVEKNIRKIKWYIPVIIFAASLVCSYYFKEVDWLFRILSVIAIFTFAFNLKLKEYPAMYARLRTYSIHFYCLHFTIILIVRHFLPDNIIAVFLLTLLLCVIASEVMIRLMDKPAFKWLRCSK